jgi:hypothetical protein
MMCIAAERLLAVALADDLLLTPEEFAHLKACRDCFEGWSESIAESGRRLEGRDYGTIDDCTIS